MNLPTTMSMTTALICAGVLGAAVFVLGFNVSRMRGVTAKIGGDQMPSDPSSPLLLAMRAHANAAEYVPTLLVLFLLSAMFDDSAWTTTLVIGATACRLVHAWGMLTAGNLAKESPVRMVGAMGTYAFGLALAVTVVVGAVAAA